MKDLKTAITMRVKNTTQQKGKGYGIRFKTRGSAGNKICEFIIKQQRILTSSSSLFYMKMNGHPPMPAPTATPAMTREIGRVVPRPAEASAPKRVPLLPPPPQCVPHPLL